MNYRESAWRGLLKEIALSLERKVLFQWTTSNGATFQMFLPDAGDFLESTFAQHVQFPFSFDEIESVRTPVDVPGFSADMETTENLRSVVANHNGFTAHQVDGGIEIFLREDESRSPWSQSQ